MALQVSYGQALEAALGQVIIDGVVSGLAGIDIESCEDDLHLGGHAHGPRGVAGLEGPEGVIFDVVGEDGADVVAQQTVVGPEVVYGLEHIGVKIAFVGAVPGAQRDGDGGRLGQLERAQGLQVCGVKAELRLGRIGGSGGKEKEGQ